ncbi:hypothetical protein HDF16_002372 [Granulicella aggregans]|uniref:Uncharacterized protein n=1 Tax=Granulicella aggregans TaxID=474949 RepID=A0A7W7ZD01_9BACT|nr:hypothetical protein [Granulicella aggregans]MBB5057666.1 hypothetical protein [Granulicella aggregans]
MSDRPDRSYWGFWACFVQSINGLVALALFALDFFLSGTLGPNGSTFSTDRAIYGSSLLRLPVVAIVFSIPLLWHRNKWGWYLTIVTNLILEWGMGYQLVRGFITEHHSSMPRTSYLGDRVFILANLMLLTPIILLLLPESRQEYLTKTPAEEAILP